MATTCPSCKAQVQPQDTRCQTCGMPLTGAANPVSGGIGGQATVPVAFPPPPASLPPPAPLHAGMLIANRYRLDTLVGSGAMGEVWRAYDEHLSDRPRAIKRVILGGATSQERAEREVWLQREAQILASLTHPAICDIFDVLEDGGSWYLILEWIEGRTLAREIAAQGRPGLPEPEVLGWTATLCSALALLHSLQPPIIFRDLKPQNIMLRAADRSVKLIDFGIARPVVTGGATVIGTPGYAPPEQYHGTVDARSDQYALAATVHQLLTGRDPTQAPPFTFPRVRSLVPALSPAVDAALDRALSMKAADRFATITDFAAALATASQSARQPPRRRVPLALSIGAILVVLVALAATAGGLPSLFLRATTPTPTVAPTVAPPTVQPVVVATNTAPTFATMTPMPPPTVAPANTPIFAFGLDATSPQVLAVEQLYDPGAIHNECYPNGIGFGLFCPISSALRARLHAMHFSDAHFNAICRCTDVPRGLYFTIDTAASGVNWGATVVEARSLTNDIYFVVEDTSSGAVVTDSYCAGDLSFSSPKLTSLFAATINYCLNSPG